MRALLVLLTLTLAACGGTKRMVVTTPRIVEIPVRVEVVVKVPSALTEPHPVAQGPLSQCPTVAAQRRSELLKCIEDKAAIAAGFGERSDSE